MTDAKVEKVYMLNALWFEPHGGREKYQAYLKAAGPIAKKYGGRNLGIYESVEPLIGEFEPDLFFVVEWPSWEVFQRFLADPGYQKVQPLREEGLTKSILLRSRVPLSMRSESANEQR